MTTHLNDQTKNYEIHELAEIFPMMEDADLCALSKDIQDNGQYETIKIWQGKIIDGRHRYMACMSAGIEPKFEEISFEPNLKYVCGLNAHRRHLTETQRAWIAAKAAKVHMCTQFDTAKMMNVSLRLVVSASVIMGRAIPEVCEQVARGRISASTGARISKLDADTQRNISALHPKKMLKAVKKAEQIRVDPAPRTHKITISFTEEEMRKIRNAVGRKGTPDTQEDIIREAVLIYCKDSYFPSEREMRKTMGFQMKSSYSDKELKVGKNGVSKYEQDELRYWAEHGRSPDDYN